MLINGPKIVPAPLKTLKEDIIDPMVEPTLASSGISELLAVSIFV